MSTVEFIAWLGVAYTWGAISALLWVLYRMRGL